MILHQIIKPKFSQNRCKGGKRLRPDLESKNLELQILRRINNERIFQRPGVLHVWEMKKSKPSTFCERFHNSAARGLWRYRPQRFHSRKNDEFFFEKKWKEIRYESITIMHVYHTRVMQHENYEKNSKKMIAWIAVARYWAKAKDLVVAKPCEMELHAGFPYPPEATLWNVVTQDKTTRNSERNGQFSGHEKRWGQI